MIQKFIITATLIASAVGLYAQDRLPGNIPTPGAAAICKYGDVPMSYYTGTPDITIPLHTLNVRDVELPIYLSYDASGVRLNQLPSWTGDNWTLHAGGCITRTVNGYPDELIAPQSVQVPATFHNYFESYGKILSYDGHNSTLFTEFLHQEETEFSDMAPDEFHFNFMGHSGTFYLGNDGQWKVAGNEDFDVLFDVANYQSHLIDPFIKQFPCKEVNSNYGTQPKVIKGFKLRDKNGTTYEFGFNANAIEYTTSLVQTVREKVESWTAVSWYLTKVTDRLGNVLYQFSYERGYFTAQLVYSYYGDTVENSVGNHWLGASDRYEDRSDPQFPVNGELESPVYLTSITTHSGVTVSLMGDYNGPSAADLYPTMHNAWAYAKWRDMSGVNYVSDVNYCAYYLQTSIPAVRQYQYRTDINTYSDSMLCRTRMKVLRKLSIHTPNVSKGFTFVYNNDESRMHTVALQQWHYNYAGHPYDEMAYRFEYNQYNRVPANYLSYKTDHWGYANIASSVNDKQYYFPQIPMTAAAKASYWQSKKPNNQIIRYGSLTKIVYPTGGATMFEYEPNKFQKVRSLDRSTMVDSVGYGGGLRVKSIAEYEDSACTVLLQKRTFSYQSGELFAKPIYYWPDWTPNTTTHGNVNIDSFRLCSIVALTDNYGPSVGYSIVTETRLDGAKIVRTYRNFSNSTHDDLSKFVNDAGPSPYDIFSEHGYMRGKLLNEQYYDNIGSKVRGIAYTYGNAYTAIDRVIASSLRIKYTSLSYSMKGRRYELYYPRYSVTAVNDTTYNADGSRIAQSTSYVGTYVTHSFTTPYVHKQKIFRDDSETVSRGDNTSTVKFDYAGADDVKSQMFYFPVISNKRYRNEIFVGGDSIVYDTFTVNGTTHQLPTIALKLFPGGVKDEILNIEQYTSTGIPSVYQAKGQAECRLYWTDNDNILMAKLVDAHGWSTPPSSVAHNLNAAIEYPQTYFPSLSATNATATHDIYTYYVTDTMGNVIATVNADGTVTQYNRDRAWRVTDILDVNGKVMKHYQYNYQNKTHN